jgi:hypothetical protein
MQRGESGESCCDLASYNEGHEFFRSAGATGGAKGVTSNEQCPHGVGAFCEAAGGGE